jgi:hypothetical protein
MERLAVANNLRNDIMKPDITGLYDRIGRLFYGIARDLGLTALEMPQFKRVVAGFWLPGSKDVSGSVVTSEGHRILLAMDASQQQSISGQQAFDAFEDFFMAYPEIFSSELKTIIIDTVTETRSVFASMAAIADDRLSALQELLYSEIYAGAGKEPHIVR